MKMYEVGGCVRDEILGVKSKDIDFSVVLDPSDRDGDAWHFNPPQGSMRESHFDYMVRMLEQSGFKIFLESPEFLTVRAQFPKEAGVQGFDVKRTGLTADFVLARKESDYADGRRPDKVEVGTLEDDLARRDFTMNAIAKDADGSLIDPFNGQRDTASGIIRAVGDPLERLEEDALRAVRALRFSVTKIRETQDGHSNFRIDPALAHAMETMSVLDSVANNISDERIQQELSKMFRFDTLGSLYALNQFDALTEAMFAGSVSLDASMKQKGRG